jgi:hypothetical protein
VKADSFGQPKDDQFCRGGFWCLRSHHPGCLGRASSGGRELAAWALGTHFVWHLYGNNMPHSPTLRNCYDDLAVVILHS